MELVTEEGKENAVLKINAFKGKKHVFRDDILIRGMDAQKLKKYFQENFEKRTLEATVTKATGSDNGKKFNIFSKKK
jgi:helix-turn-helix protein